MDFYKDGYLYSCSVKVTFYIVHPCLLRTTGYTIDFDTVSRGMSAEHGVVNVLIVGHSFVRRLATYALSVGELNMRLNRGDCSVTFISRGGMSLPQLRSRFDDIVSRAPHVLYIEIGCIDISGQDPLSLATEVFELARSFSACGVCRVVIGQIFFRNLAAAILALRSILTNAWLRTIYT